MLGRKISELVLGLSRREHDVAIFSEGDEITDESFLGELLNGSLYQGRCWL